MNTYQMQRIHQKHDIWRLVSSNRKRQIAFMQLHPGAQLSESVQGDSAEKIHVVSGVVEITVGGHKERYKAGSLIDLPSPQEHTIKNVGEKPLKLYMIYNAKGAWS